MKAFYDPNRVPAAGRLHPYAASSHDQTEYLDLKENPEKIAVVLEDFRPFDYRPAVQAFYDLLRQARRGPPASMIYTGKSVS